MSMGEVDGRSVFRCEVGPLYISHNGASCARPSCLRPQQFRLNVRCLLISFANCQQFNCLLPLHSRSSSRLLSSPHLAEGASGTARISKTVWCCTLPILERDAALPCFGRLA